MTGKVCSKCDVGWMIRLHEWYCGYCGCQVYDFSAKWEKEPLLYLGNGSDTLELTILVENNGACPITFQPIQTKRKKAIQLPEKYKNPFQVKAGQSHPIKVQVKPANLALHPETIIVSTQEGLPSLEGGKSLRLQALQRPDFKLVGSTNVRYRKGVEKVTVGLRVEVLKSRFYIDNVKLSPGRIRRVGFSKECHEKDQAMKSIHLEFDCSKLNDGVNSETLHFKLRGLSKPIEKTIQVQAEVEPEPPRLFVQKMNLEVTQDREKTCTLAIQNRGEQPLTIQHMAFSDPTGLVRLSNIDFPINVEGGGHQNVDVLISANNIAPAMYPINFTIISNSEAAQQYQDVLDVTVKQREEYPFHLAIDFGTTNSCCTYIDLNTFEPKLIPLDSKVSLPDIMPSSIVYHSRPTNGNKYHVGYEADTYRTSEIDGSYYITSAKRWLGYEWERPFPNNLQLQPRDVVADILKHIIAQAENHLDALTTKSKIKKCVVTYPTMFSREQQTDLRRAFEKINITNLILIDEASAASIGTIFQRGVEYGTRRDNYRLLVYDFGGGTIDIVLSQVISDGNNITIEPLAHGGNPKYGGDDVTQAIVNFVLNEFKQRIQRTNPDLCFDIPYLNPRKIWEPSGNPNIDRAAKNNANRLYLEAEKMKRELSEKSETIGTFTGLESAIGSTLSTVESLIPHHEIYIKISQQQLQSLIGAELKGTFTDIDTMITDNGAQTPDIVVLAGQSSKMSLVKEMMTIHLKKRYQKDIEIHLEKHPKVCVVKGAARYSLTYDLPNIKGGKVQPIDMANKTRSRLGIAQMSWEGPVFGEIISKGKRIPDESFATMDFPLSEPMVVIDVREHLGVGDDLANTSPIDIYTLTFPKEVTRAALQKARLTMAVKVSGNIELTALVDGIEYKSTVQKKSPAFVDEI